MRVRPSLLMAHSGISNAVGNWWGASGGANTSGAQTTLGTVTTSSHLSSAPSSCTINPNPTPTPTPSPTPTVPICEGFSLLEETCPTPCEILETTTLDDFGIDFDNEENWEDEADDILRAARVTGRALCLAGVDADSVVEAFQTVMVGEGNVILFRRFDQAGAYCTTSPPNPEPGITAYINCDFDVVLSQYTVVHEFGHVFSGRTGSAFRDWVEYPNESTGPALEDGAQGFVMGVTTYDLAVGPRTDWQRSDVRFDNGWGSAALWNQTSYSTYEFPTPVQPPTPTPPIPTEPPLMVPRIGPCGEEAPTYFTPVPGTPFPFQQNPCTFPNWEAENEGDGRTEEIEEAAADMFLNWVYWKLSLGGFSDTLWRLDHNFDNCYSSGCPDEDGSGQARNEWMDQKMTILLNDLD